MNPEDFQTELVDLLQKYKPQMVVFAFGMAYYDDADNIAAVGNTICPIPPRDHEEDLLRSKAAKDITLIVDRLVKNIYEGR